MFLFILVGAEGAGDFADRRAFIFTLLMQDTDIATKRVIALKCLILNMGEAVEDLIKDFLVRQP